MKRKLKIDKLVLDIKNPRLPSIMENEISIIEHMMDKEQIMNLLEDIAKNWLSPIEDIAVFEGIAGYVVLEGNRRVSALKLLENPDLLPPYSKRIKDILKRYDTKLVDVECEVFDKREDANLWLERKHSGQQNGVGTKSWSAEQKTRFEGSTSNNNTLAVNIIDFAKRNEIDEVKVDGILTTVTRFLANPAFRNSIGVKSSTKDSSIIIDIPEEQFTTLLEKFISDVADKTNKKIGSRANKDDVINYGDYLYDNYLKGIERVGIYKLNNLNDSIDTNESKQKDDNNIDKKNAHKSKSSLGERNYEDQGFLNNKEEESTSNTSSRQRSSRNPNNRKYVFTTDFYCKSSDKMIMAIYHELRTIEVETLSLSCAMMTRVFVESILKKYLEQVSTNKKNRSKLDDVINEVNTHLSSKESLITLSSTQEVSLKSLKLLTEKRGLALSPFSLGINAHGGAYPKATDLKTDWMNIEPIIKYILDETK